MLLSTLDTQPWVRLSQASVQAMRVVSMFVCLQAAGWVFTGVLGSESVRHVSSDQFTLDILLHKRDYIYNPAIEGL